MMNIISSIVNSGYIVDRAVVKNTSVNEGSFQNALQEERGKIKKVSEASSLKPYGRNEINDEEKYKSVKKTTHQDSAVAVAMAVMKSTIIVNPIRSDSEVEDKVKLINLVKTKNAYHI
ncbi:hypothetical protein [Cellulosilyticum sp. I15G10I2]|uniref:hypothetical protein n=1 Tax=Cellulosilyticum sp. I15G10I2 TaxID=1892843 RepID=UPI00085CA057|nr:hypothetical protein [Cellulosilyticum sp. I15G10I2]